MRSRATFFILFFAVSLLTIPLFVHANSIPFFGPIIPPSSISGIPNSDTCPAGWGMLIIVINNIILLLLTLAIVFVAPLMIAWSGFLFVVNPVHAEGISKAKGILRNTVVGIVIALAGWLIVDALMAVLYNGKFGTWSEIITSGGADQCLPQKGTEPGAKPTVAPPGVTTVPSGAPQGYYQKYPSLLEKDQIGSNWTQAEKDKLYTGTEATGILRTAGVEINRGYSPVGQDCGTQCTSLNGIPKATIATLVDAEKNCSTCTVTITGGTEGGHQSQGFGKASIDLRYDESTYNYLTSKSVQVVREAPLGSSFCGTNGWQCYAHVTAPHMSVYTSGGTVI